MYKKRENCKAIYLLVCLFFISVHTPAIADNLCLVDLSSLSESDCFLANACDISRSLGVNLITKPGFYFISRTVSSSLVIKSSDVVLELSGNTVQGGITIGSNLQNVTIQNGIVDCSSTLIDGIATSAGCNNIVVQNMQVKNGARGIFLNGVTNGLVANCELTLNSTGASLTNSHNIVFDNTVTLNNQLAGFDLLNSTTCIFQNCKALSTGKGNTTISNNFVCGFVSNNGYGNIFERCIANSTQALSTTDANSIVAGFALQGSEGGSKIINCESANATTSPNGFTIPYGILLQSQVSQLQTVTAWKVPNPFQSYPGVFSAAWSPDGIYLLVSANQEFIVYEIDYLHGALSQIISKTLPIEGPYTYEAFICAWSPYNYLALASKNNYNAAGNPNLFIYYFDTNSKQISLTQSILVPSNVYNGTYEGFESMEWSPDGKLLTVAFMEQGNQVVNYRFDVITQQTTLLQSISLGGTSIIAWSPDSRYLAVGVNAGGSLGLFLYSFNPGTGLLTLVDSHTTNEAPRTFSWSPDGRYLVTWEYLFPNPNLIKIFQFNNTTQKLQLIYSTPVSFVTDTKWSADGRYLLVIGDLDASNHDLAIYQFDPGTPSLNLVRLAYIDGYHYGSGDGFLFGRWSPDGQYIITGGESSGTTILTLFLLDAFTFPSNNVITNNTVYCNSGGSIPSGIGISGSSVANIIIQNTAYSNPIAPFMVDTSYAFVQNVFNQQLGIGPTGVQNIAVGYRQVITMPDNFSLLLKQDISLVQSAIAQLASLQAESSSFSAACSGIPISQGPITTGGSYCLANDITSGGLAINASNVTLDLNGRRVAGGITFSNQNFIKIMNGVVLGTASTNGITATNSSNVTLDHVTMKNGSGGASFNTVLDSTISACSFVQNFTGALLTSCANVSVDSCVAMNNSTFGFQLITSTTCTITNCKALSTGQGNTQTSGVTIGGFVTTSGNSNIFENCIANVTQGLIVTDFDSVVAGFAFLGTEACSKIISCEASNASTSSSGFTVPYGILLQGYFSGALTLANSAPSPTPTAQINGMVWSPDAQYLATGGNEGIIRVYQFNRVTGVLSSVTNVSVQTSGSILTIDWHPSGKFLAVTVNASSPTSYINIYSFSPANNALTLVAEQNIQNASNTQVFAAWNPSGTILAAVEDNAINMVYAYQFNIVTNTLTLLGAGSNLGATPYEISWSPDGNYLAIVESQRAEVYSFSQSNAAPFTLNASVSISSSTFFDGRISWSPDGKYLAVGRNDSTSAALIIYSFSSGSLTMGPGTSLGAPGTAGTFIPVSWSNDSRYVVAGHDTYLQIYEFQRSTSSLVATSAFSTVSTNINRLAWSKDGGLIALADNAVSPYFFLYTALSFPSSNVIQNNVVYDNSGGSIPSGIGISGSSITNMIIQNTAYTNPIPQTTGTNPGPMVFTNYAFATNVFNDQLQNMPTLLQNISLATVAVNSPQNSALLIQQALSRITSAGMCGPTALTIDNVSPGSGSGSYGTLNIATGGGYCLSQDLTVDMLTINASSVTLDLNGNSLNGAIQVNSFSNVIIKNGTVYYNGRSGSPVINMVGTTNGLIQNVDVINPDATGSGSSVIGVQLSGTTNCQIIGCTITSGNASGTNASASAIGLANSASYSLIKNCIIRSGSAGTAGNGSNAGHGIQVSNDGSAVNNVEIVGCTIMATGNGGFESGAAQGGNGGNGIITGPNALKVSIHDCTIRNTGTGGSGTPAGLPGKAIFDQADTTGSLSVIFKNFAFYIANPTKFDIMAPGVGGGPEKGVYSPNPPNSTVLNTWANIFTHP